jgi:molybdopterin converting factor small subunit
MLKEGMLKDLFRRRGDARDGRADPLDSSGVATVGSNARAAEERVTTMPMVWIPALLRALTGEQEQVTVPGKSVGEVVENLDHRYPGVKGRLVEEGRLKPHISVAVDGEVTPEGLQQPVAETSEVHFIPALSGGASVAPRG